MTRDGHLVRDFDRPNQSAADNLRSILAERALYPGRTRPWVSDARFGRRTAEMSEEEQRRFFHAICFTETPLNEVHCLLEIDGRKVDLKPYGFAFLTERLEARGVAPVLYLNNVRGDLDQAFQDLCSLIDTHPETAEKILPLVAVFGQKIRPLGAAEQLEGEVDFRWEREWRYPASQAPLHFDYDDVFIGLCPHEEIEAFEEEYPPLTFIDPRRNMRWYATKLIAARQRLNMRYSVV